MGRSFDYRFNSFYAKEMHPFIGAMVRALAESGARTRRLPLQNRLMLITKRQYEEDTRLMHQIADELIADRKKHGDPGGKTDILSTMLTALDPQTGERLSEENVSYQMVTFLIAGHETTSGLLSFTLYALLRHPEVMARAREEVERVMGSEAPRFDLSLVDPDCKLETKETLTLKPHGLEIYAKRRDNVIVEAGRSPGTAVPSARSGTQSSPKASNGIPIHVLYGSNAGSAEAFAQRIATDTRAQGYSPILGPLDSAVGSLPKEGAVVVVTASYEGHVLLFRIGFLMV